MSGIGNLGKQKVGWQLPQAGERENGEKLLNGHRVSFWGDEGILELGRDCGYTTLGMY